MRFSIFSILFLFCLAAFSTNINYPITPNKGQWKGDFNVKLKHQDFTMFLDNKDTWTYVFQDQEKLNQLHDNPSMRFDSNMNNIEHFAYDVTFINGDLSNYSFRDSSSYYSNYFVGNEEKYWKSNIRSYKGIYYKEVWEKIDIYLFQTESGQIKYDFIVHPGGDVRSIRIKYNGTECTNVEKGKLKLGLALHEIIEDIPLVYSKNNYHSNQILEDEIFGSFKIENDEVLLNVSDYDNTKTLVIDPILIFASASGSSGHNWGYCATYDNNGNTLGGASVSEVGFPTTLGAYTQSYPGITAMGINKISSDGTTLIWCTYLGSTNGVDIPLSLVCNSGNDLYIFGRTKGSTFPMLGNSFQSSWGGNWDIVIGKISANGMNLLGSTFFGGSNVEGYVSAYPATLYASDETKGEIVMDDEENVLVISSTKSTDLPIVDPNMASLSVVNSDALILKFSSDLSTLLQSRLLGGSANDLGFGIISDADSNIYVVGNTASSNFPTTLNAHTSSLAFSNSCNGFLVHLNDSFEIINSTYVESENGVITSKENVGTYFIDLNTDNNPVICGVDRNCSFSSIGGGIEEGLGLVYFSTYTKDLNSVLKRGSVGGGLNSTDHIISLSGFKVDDCDNMYFSSFYNRTMPTTSDSLLIPLVTNSEDNNYYLGAVSNDSLYFGTYYYGDHVDGGTSRFDDNGIVHQAICAKGYFVTTANAAFDNSALGSFDLKLIKYDLEFESALVKIDTLGIGNNILGCINDSIQLSLTSDSGPIEDIEWFVNGSLVDTGMFCSVFLNTHGTYNVVAKTDENSCGNNEKDSLLINVFDVIPDFNGDTILCVNQAGIFNNNTTLPSGVLSSSILEYNWTFGDGNIGAGSSVSHSYDTSGVYNVGLELITALCSYITVKPLYVSVLDVEVDFSSLNFACVGEEVIFDIQLQIPSEFMSSDIEYFWDFGDGTSSNDENPIHIYQNQGQYDIELIVKIGDCEYTIDKPNYIQINEVDGDFAFEKDTLFFPEEHLLNANSILSSYDSIVWEVKGEHIINEESISIEINPQNNFEEIEVTLYIFENGCLHKVTKPFYVLNNERFVIPNAFTPNGDGLNEEFKPVGRLIDNAKRFRFSIYNRWGEKIFVSHDKNTGWFGFNKHGKEVQTGLYVWTLEIVSSLEGEVNAEGYVKLIR
ncbi:MAG: PKD domain-containing protein [Flavobacteriales bacterium]